MKRWVQLAWAVGGEQRQPELIELLEDDNPFATEYLVGEEKSFKRGKFICYKIEMLGEENDEQVFYHFKEKEKVNVQE